MIGLSKAICQKCYGENKHPWELHHDVYWYEKDFVFCAAKMPKKYSDLGYSFNGSTKVCVNDPPPNQCPYLLEHVISGST